MTQAQLINKKINDLFSKDTATFEEVAVAGLEIIDLSVIEIKKEANITCRGKKCSHCCTNSIIGLSYIEYLNILKVYPEAKKRIKRKAPNLKKSIMGKYINDNLNTNKLGDCPFLKNDLCQIYDARPIACRTFFSIDDPKLCEDGKSHNLINSNSNEVTKYINETFQAICIDNVPKQAYLEIRDFFK